MSEVRRAKLERLYDEDKKSHVSTVAIKSFERDLTRLLDVMDRTAFQVVDESGLISVSEIRDICNRLRRALR